MDKNIFDNTEIAFQSKSNAQLKKAYRLFQLISYPSLTEAGNKVAQFFINLNFPLVKSLIKNTLYEQFVGGESLNDSLPTVYELYKYHIFSILDYSVEGKTTEDSFENTFQEILENIRWAKEKKEIPFVVFKPTGIGNISIYEKIGRGETLTEKEKEEWERIVNRFHTLAKATKKNEVPMMVDAEESWVQSAIDPLVEKLMKSYNKEKVYICNTLQMYRKDRLQYLKEAYEEAKDQDYLLGYKIVRGAYMEKEKERAKEEGYESPIQPNKEATDRDYNEAIAFILSHHEKISLYAGTHNEKSCLLAIESMKKENLQNDYHKAWFGQLYGMSDNLSYNLAHEGYNVAKYVPYGPVKEVIPYLSRRAQENTSVAGQTGRELGLITEELKRRKLVDD